MSFARDTEVRLTEKSFDHEWVIKNWTDVVQNETMVETTKTEIKCEADKLIYGKFIVGLKLFGTSQKVIGFHWKKCCQHYCLKNAQINLIFKVLNNAGAETTTYKCKALAENGKAQNIDEHFWNFARLGFADQWTNSEGSLILRLKITFSNLPRGALRSELAGLTKFGRECFDELKQNLTSLMYNSSLSDLKIISKDNTEFFANKTILCARCPVFTSMFRSDFLECSTGQLNVDDISAKTMNILLTYWYTGELLPSWKDEDIVAEFTYAAGKYQMKQVLNMLNETLGKDFTASDEDVELLKMVEKLSLKDAECSMLKRIVDKVSQVTSGVELLEMFSLSTENVEEDNFNLLQVLKSYDDALSDQDEKDACQEDVKLMVLACKLGMKNVESQLLKLISSTVNKVVSANELFKLFTFQVERPADSSSSMDLLVRANTMHYEVELNE